VSPPESFLFILSSFLFLPQAMPLRDKDKEERKNIPDA
jgi:hypothetical protein